MSPSKSPRQNGVLIYLFICMVWSSFLALLISWQGYKPAAQIMAVPAFDRPFNDMRIITEALEAAGRGQDVRGADYLAIGTMWIRFPYPPAWLGFKCLGIQEKHTVPLAVCFSLLMLAHFGYLIWQNGNGRTLGLTLAAFACSPPILLALERGNPDIFLYLLLALVCQLLPSQSFVALSTGACLLFSAGVLKFFPFAGSLSILPGIHPIHRRAMFAVFCFAAVSFLWFERAEVMRIATSPLASSDWCSFGAAVSVNTIIDKFTKLTGTALPPIVPGLIRWFAVLFLLLLSLRQALSIWKERAALDAERGPLISGFAAGAGIFTGSFILIRSYNYKFIFLALAIPALCRWSEYSDRRGTTARAALITLLLWIWSPLNGYAGLLMNMFASWLVAGCIASLLFAWLLEQADGLMRSPAGEARVTPLETI